MTATPTLEERLKPARRPNQPAIMRQNWRQLLFLHWEVPVEALRRVVPAALDIDTYEGRAYVGVIPFAVEGMRLPFAPPVPGLSAYLELNVRTYVHVGGREPGVWFFSLDANSLAAVVGARAGFRLPYCHADMRLEAGGANSGSGTGPSYWSARKAFGKLPAVFDASAQPGATIGSATPGTLEHFLVERYLLYTQWAPDAPPASSGQGLRVGQVHHFPYPLQEATAQVHEVAMLLQADGLPAPTGEPHVLFSPGVDVEIFPLRRPYDA